MADELKVRLSVDVADFKSGMNEGAQSTRTLKDASADLKQALGQLAEAERELGPAVEAGSAQCAAILEEYRERVATLQAEIDSLRSATQQLASAEAQEVEVTRSNITAKAALSAEIRLAEGSMGSLNRSAAAYLSTLGPVAQLSQAAFAVAGPIALIAVLGQVAEAAVRVGKAYKEMGADKRRAELNDIEEQNGILRQLSTTDKFFSKTTAVRVINGDFGDIAGQRVDVQQFSSLEQNVQEYNKKAAARRADNEAGLQGAALRAQQKQDLKDEYNDLQKVVQGYTNYKLAVDSQLSASHKIEVADGLFGSKQVSVSNVDKDSDAGKALTKNLEDVSKALRSANTESEVLLSKIDAAGKREVVAVTKDDAKAARAAEKQQRELLQAMQVGRQQQIDEGKLGAQADLDYWTQRISAFTKGSEQYKAVLGKMDADKKELARFNEQYQGEQAQGAEITARNAEAQALAGVQMDVATGKITKLEGVQRSAAIEADFYTQKLRVLRTELESINAAKDLAPEEKRNRGQVVQNKIIETEGQRDHSASESGVQEAEAKRDADARAAEAQQRLGAEQTQGTLIVAQNTEQTRLAVIASQEHDGSLTRVAAAYQTAEAHAELYRTKLAQLKKELDDLKASGANLQPGSAAANENAAAQQRVQNQITQVGGQAKVSGIKDQAAIKDDIAAPYISAFNEVTTASNRMFDEMLTGHKNFAQASRGLEQSLALYAIHQGEQELEKFAVKETLKLARHMGFLTAKTTADTTQDGVDAAGKATTAATVQAMTVTANIAQIQSYAAVAAAAAYAAYAAVPPAAVAAAGSAYGAVSSFSALASFDQGTSAVPKDGIAMVHKGEAILPPPQTQALMQVLSVTQQAGNQMHGSQGANPAQAMTPQPPAGHTFHSNITYHDHRKGMSAGELARQSTNRLHRMAAVMPPR